MRIGKSRAWKSGYLMLFILSGCGATETAELAAPGDVPTFEEFREESRTVVDGKDYFLVEGDMLLDYESFVRYYEDRFFKLKAIVATVVDSTGAEFDAIRENPMKIRYCFSDGWGGDELSLSTARTLVRRAVADWAGVARVRFNYVSSLDGDECNQAAVGTDTDLVIGPNTGKGGSYAWWAYAVASEVRFGSKATQRTARHELGHVLGFDHEQFHSDSGLGCTELSYAGPKDSSTAWGEQRELTAYDPESIMHYFTGDTAACTRGGGDDPNRPISRLDGISARLLYGNPDWWAIL